MIVKVLPMSKRKSPGPARTPISRRGALVYDILRTAGVLRRSYSDLFDKRDITYQQYNVLRILRGAGSRGLPTLEIVKRMIEQTPGITRLLDRLEGKQLIRRERPASNRRQVICYVTQKGLDLLREMDRPLLERVNAAGRCLSNAEVEKLMNYLERIRSWNDGGWSRIKQ
jgi:DNA-binding MarR family transcriptional regulator